MTPERIEELQDAAMGKRGIEPINPVEVQQLLGEVAFLRAKLAAVEPKVAAAEKANVDWAAANADLRALLELVAGNLRAAWEKRDDAPQSANSHLQEASFALVKFAPKGGEFSQNAKALRLLVREEMAR